MKHKSGTVQSSDSEHECNGAAAASPPRRLKSVDISDYKLFEEQQRTTQIVYKYKGGKKVPKLREPRNLFTFNENNKQQPPRWPSEVKVINLRPRFIEYNPKEPEPFWEYGSNDGLFGLAKTANDSGQLVYDNSPSADKYFCLSSVGGTTIPNKPFYTLHSNDDDTLVFESRFESGNLKRAIKVGPNEYQLWMNTDLYTIKHTQWFFFRLRNTRAGVTYRFHVMNFIKSNSLYNSGMKPLFYSEMDAYKNKVGWTRRGEDIKYYRNDIRREDTNKDRYHYSLSWSCQFPQNKDTCYFAHCYPYTYSDLQEYLAGVRNDPIKTRLCKQRVLCRTLCGNFVYILTITNPSRRPADAEAKRAVVVTARVHPGETNSSWMMKGLLDFLTSNNPDAKLLRDTFVFKIVPMINPDGVIVGNYRCSLTGRDLNRNYRSSLKDCYPPIWHIKNMVKNLIQEREVVLYCDFHGHSRKQNVFMYGCDNKTNPLRRLREKIFPMMMSKNAPFKFSYKECKFKVQKSKEGTGRIVMWNLGIMNSFTMEATFCGSSLGKRNGFHFNTVDLEAMGYHLCDTLLDYCDPDDTKYIMLLRELEDTFKSEILQRMKQKGMASANMTISDIDMDAEYPSDMESSTGGSDSSVSDGLPMHLIYASHTVQYNQQSKKKKLRSRKERNKRRAKAMKIKNVLLIDAPRQEPEESEVKMSYKKSTKTNRPPSRQKQDKHSAKHDHQRVCSPTSPMRLCKEHANNHKGAAYLEAVTNAYMLSGLLVSDLRSDIPQFGYTDGSHLKDIQSAVNRQGSITRWSTDSGGGMPHPGEEEEGTFTVSYLAKQLEKNSDCTIPLSKADARAGSAALDLARKITMYNSRYKMEQQLGKDSCDVPVLRPASPSTLWRNPTLSRTHGKILSSTKAHLHHQPKRYQSISDLRSSSMEEAISSYSTHSQPIMVTPSDSIVSAGVAVIRTMKGDDRKLLYRGRPEITRKYENERIISKDASSRSMSKYTTMASGLSLPRETEQVKQDKQATSSSSIKPSSMTNSLNQASPSYVALNHQTISKKRGMTGMKYQQGMAIEHHVQGQIGQDNLLPKASVKTPSELKRIVVDPKQEPGKLISYALQRLNEEPEHQVTTSDNISYIDSNDDDESGPFISKFSMMSLKSPKRQTSPYKSLADPQQNTSGTIASVNIGMNAAEFSHTPAENSLVDNQLMYITKTKQEKEQGQKEYSNKVQRNNPSPSSIGGAPSKISLTFQATSPSKTETIPDTSTRQGAFHPHFKHLHKTHR